MTNPLSPDRIAEARTIAAKWIPNHTSGEVLDTLLAALDAAAEAEGHLSVDDMEFLGLLEANLDNLANDPAVCTNRGWWMEAAQRVRDIEHVLKAAARGEAPVAWQVVDANGKVVHRADYANDPGECEHECREYMTKYNREPPGPRIGHAPFTVRPLYAAPLSPASAEARSA